MLISTHDVLFTCAQGLFMMLPLISMYTLSHGKPTPLHPPRVLAAFCGIAAFSLLVIMFALDDANAPSQSFSLGVGLCVANLCLRFVEAGRLAQLHARRPAAGINAKFLG